MTPAPLPTRHTLLALGLALAGSLGAQGVVINELLPANERAYPGGGGAYDDYVELYNAGGAAVNLGGYGLSDRRDEPYRYTFPAFTIEAGGRYMVSAGAEGLGIDEAVAEFALSSGGETVYLTDAGGVLLDSIAYPATVVDVAYARAGDGGAVWGLATPTPNAPNVSQVAAGLAPAVVVEGVVGALTARAAEAAPECLAIRYTLDGSPPDAGSPLWEGALAFDATAVVRARAFAPGLWPGPVATRAFVAGESTDLPVVNVAIDPPALFDPVDGLWQLGPTASRDFPYIGANFYLPFEVEAHFTLFDDAAAAAAGEPAFADDVALRVFGNASRLFPQKSSALTARPAFGSRDDELPHDFFPTWRGRDAAPRGLVLRNHGNDYFRAHMRDGLVATLARNTNNDVLAYRPVIAYYNGEYYGLYGLRERANEHYAARRLGVDVEEVDLVETRGNLPPTDFPIDNGTFDAYLELLAFYDRTDFGAGDAFDSLAARFDLDNFLDYYATEVYVANEDWPSNNNRIYRERRAGARWRYILYDADLSFAFDPNSSPDAPGALARLLDPDGPDFPNSPTATRFFREAIVNDGLRAAYGNRTADLLNFDFHPDTVRATVDSLAARIAPEIDRYRARWADTTDFEPWPSQVDSLRRFARVRPASLRDALRRELGFGPDAALDLAIAGPDGAGAVAVNDYRRVRAAAWSGIYFAGTDVELRAEPTSGYVFERWEGLPPGLPAESATVRFDPAAPPGTVTAVFAINPEPVTDVYINEVNYRSPDGADAGDWLELYNPTAATVSLAGFTVGDYDPLNVYTFPADAELAAGGYAVVVRDSARFAAIHPGVARLPGELGFGFSGGGERIALRDATGRLVDSLRYGVAAPWPTAPAGGGPSLELRRDAPDTDAARDEAASWQASFVDGGTPGAVNSVMGSDTDEPAVGRLEVWPVPAGTQLSLRVPASLDGHAVLRDAVGRAAGPRVELQGGTVATFPVRGLPAGLYTLTVERNGRVVARAPVILGSRE